MQPRGLGRGLQSLIPTQTTPERFSETTLIPIDKIRPNPFQPRQSFEEEKLKDLANSIQSQGLIQPLVVTPISNSSKNGHQYELIAGERRWRAAQLANLKEVPVLIKKVSPQEQLQIALIENIQREDLNPIEEAKAYQQLANTFKLTQEELARILGKGRVVVANTLRLLSLPSSLQSAVADGVISAGHARNLVSLENQDLQKKIAEKILKEHLTVREVEKIVADWKASQAHGRKRSPHPKDAEIRALETTLQQILGTRLEIKVKGKGKNIKGSINIAYFSLEDLERLIELLKKH